MRSVLCSVNRPGIALGYNFSRESSLCLSLSSFLFLSLSLPLSLAIPWFGMLSHISSLRLPSGHSGLVLTLSNAACTSLFSPWLLVADVRVWATSLLVVAVNCIICGFYLFIYSSWLCCPLRFQNSPQTHQWEGFLVFGNFSFRTPSLGLVSIPNSCLSFYLLYFVLPPFKDNGLPFWVPGVLCQCSEVVLWYLLSVQMICWWICRGESGLTILFLCHLRSPPQRFTDISYLSSYSVLKLSSEFLCQLLYFFGLRISILLIFMSFSLLLLSLFTYQFSDFLCFFSLVFCVC